MEEITEYLNPGGKSIDKKEWLKLIDEVDKNKDGKVHMLMIDEFIKTIIGKLDFVPRIQKLNGSNGRFSGNGYLYSRGFS